MNSNEIFTNGTGVASVTTSTCADGTTQGYCYTYPNAKQETSIEYIKQLLEVMKAGGVDEFSCGDIKVKFAPDSLPTSIEPSSEMRRQSIADLLKAETDDQDADLLWSVT
jgi:hypothetical protein